VTPLREPSHKTFVLMDPSSSGPTRRAVRLVEGTRLHGMYQASGHREAPWLIQRRDGSVVEVSSMLFLLATTLDGTRQPGEIAAVMSAESGRRISAADVSYLVEQKLRPLRVVEEPTAVARVEASTPVLGLSLRAAVVPEHVVNKATTWLQHLFEPPVVIAVLAAMVCLDAWLVFGTVLDTGVNDLLYSPSLVLMAAAMTVLASAFHELGHAAACRYAGARPGVIGVGVYLLWPVFYNDLNDCYRLSRSARLRADLGGVYFNAVLILVFAGVYAITGFTPVLVVVVLHHLLIAQQFLPFVRLDGYYIVSDLAGVPDLFRYVRPVLASLVPGRRLAQPSQTLRAGPRALVTAWVLVSVPLLVGCLVLLVVRLPQLMVTLADSAGRQYDLLVAAIRAGSTGSALASALQLVFVAIPAVGLSAVVLRVMLAVGRRHGRSSLRRSSGRRAEPAEPHAVSSAGRPT